jgi:hypothetical protein
VTLLLEIPEQKIFFLKNISKSWNHKEKAILLRPVWMKAVGGGEGGSEAENFSCLPLDKAAPKHYLCVPFRERREQVRAAGSQRRAQQGGQQSDRHGKVDSRVN